jgi:hypothetical protein
MRIEVCVGRERNGGRNSSDSGWRSAGGFVAASAGLVVASAAAIAADAEEFAPRDFSEQFAVFRKSS